MAIYKFFTYSASAFGLGPYDIGASTVTVGAPPVIMTVQDDDGIFDDETSAENSGGAETLDTTEQILSAPIGAAVPGQVVQSVYKWEVYNQQTGQTGLMYLIRIYDGTDPTNPGGQFGEYYYSSTIPLNLGDELSLYAADYGGQVPYTNLYVCFTRGTRILTARGDMPVEWLRPGDLVQTLDNGLQPLRWIGNRCVLTDAETAPIQFAPHALQHLTAGLHPLTGAPDCPRALTVSPNHRMLIPDPRAQLYFGDAEVLVPAKHLLGLPGVSRLVAPITHYFHLLLDRHEILFANGRPTESFLPAAQALETLAPCARAEVLALCPAPYITARPCLTAAESRVLLAPPQQPALRMAI